MVASIRLRSIKVVLTKGSLRFILHPNHKFPSEHLACPSRLQPCQRNLKLEYQVGGWTKSYSIFARLYFILMSLHNLLANCFQCLPCVLKVAYFVPNLGTAPYPDLAVMREMCHVGIPVINQSLSEDPVDGPGVLDFGRDGQGDIYLESVKLSRTNNFC